MPASSAASSWPVSRCRWSSSTQHRRAVQDEDAIGRVRDDVTHVAGTSGRRRDAATLHQRSEGGGVHVGLQPEAEHASARRSRSSRRCRRRPPCRWLARPARRRRCRVRGPCRRQATPRWRSQLASAARPAARRRPEQGSAQPAAATSPGGAEGQHVGALAGRQRGGRWADDRWLRAVAVE